MPPKRNRLNVKVRMKGSVVVWKVGRTAAIPKSNFVSPPPHWPNKKRGSAIALAIARDINNAFIGCKDWLVAARIIWAEIPKIIRKYEIASGISKVFKSEIVAKIIAIKTTPNRNNCSCMDILMTGL